MKKILTLVILVLPFLALSNDRYRPLEGKWIEKDFGTSIQVKHQRNFIKVQGLKRRGLWSRFDRTSQKKIFRDCDGNIIRVGDFGNLIYKNKRRGERLNFIRLRRGEHNNGHWDDGYGRLPSDRYDRGDYNRDRYHSDRYQEGSSRDRKANLGGVWYSDVLRKKVFIENTNSGFRAKVGKNGKWTNYSSSRFNRNKFVDNRGNSIEVNRDGSLLWKGGKGYKNLILNRRYK